MALRYSARLVRLAILSDIHANLPAMEAVLADIDDAGIEALWCLGDVVGYGAQPDECTRLVAERCELCLVGNHDLAVLGELDDSSFSPAAAAAVRWTRETARPETIDFLRGLKPADESREGRWLLNPGSVGQPRDGDPRAAWLELDTDAWEATYHRIDYEIDRAADAIVASELPEHLAKRLYVGQ